MGLDGPGADRNALALTAGRDHHHAGHLPVHPPQGAAVQLAEAADAGGRVEDPAHLARCPVAYEDVTDGEVAELAALVGAGARDQVGDDLVELAVAARRLGQFAVAEARAGAADQAVRDGLGRGAAEDQGACLVAGRALLGHERGHLYGVAALQGAVRPADHPAEGGEDGGEAGGQGDQGGDGLAPAEALLGDPDPGSVGADECGGDQGGAVDEGGGSGPGRAVGECREEQADEGGGPGRADGELALAAQQGREGRQHDAEQQEAARRVGASGADPEQVERRSRPRTDVQAGFPQERGRVGEERERPRGQSQHRGADGGEEAEPVRRDVVAAQREHAEAEHHGERPDDGGERGGDGEEQGVRPGRAPAAARRVRAGAVAETVGGDGGAGDQREQDEQDGGAEAAGGQGAGRGGQEGVRDARPGPQQPRGEQRPGGEVRGEPGQRDRADQDRGDGEAGGAQEEGRQGGEQRQVGRGGLGGAGGDGVPGVRVPAPELSGLRGGGQQGAARQGAAGEQVAAGDEGDHEQQDEEDGAGLAADPLEPRELVDFEEVRVVAAGAGLDGAVP
ncbi:hypothetical protein Smic_29330 [Streptomyces microflavus]|uniref:Uncharacterized protein n=1 Tax=Streptomyces microflavus TaxID=1919 RepID=A0A7J0CRL5_STRMI|nr:hypothetical protein Smic_29330 [Streptomyces microflavus]